MGCRMRCPIVLSFFLFDFSAIYGALGFLFGDLNWDVCEILVWIHGSSQHGMPSVFCPLKFQDLADYSWLNWKSWFHRWELNLGLSFNIRYLPEDLADWTWWSSNHWKLGHQNFRQTQSIWSYRCLVLLCRLTRKNLFILWHGFFALPYLILSLHGFVPFFLETSALG